MQTSTNWFAVIVAVIAGMFIGFLWYGLFFVEGWQEGVGLTTEDNISFFKDGVAVEVDPVTPMLINTVVLVVLAILMSWLAGKAGHTTYASGAIIGLVVGTFVAAMTMVGNLFAMESSSLSAIDGTYYLVLFTVMGAIVGGWRKRTA